MAWKHRLLDIVFPRTCVRCGCHLRDAEDRFTCLDCRHGYAFIREPFCERCGAPFYGSLHSSRACPVCREQAPLFRQARSLFLYRRTGARVVHALKYEKGTWLLPEIAALVGRDRSWDTYFRGSLLVPVPLHRRKQRLRGYNQSAIIAEAINRAVPNACVAGLLERVRATPSQTFLTRKQRQRNMRGAFRTVEPCGDLSRRVVLVDDVLTTGATLNAATGALRKAGFRDVRAFTLAHG